MNNHQGIKAEIDARNDSFTACIELGKSLLARKHYASEEVGTIRRTSGEVQDKLFDKKGIQEPLKNHISFFTPSCAFTSPTDQREVVAVDGQEERYD